MSRPSSLTEFSTEFSKTFLDKLEKISTTLNKPDGWITKILDEVRARFPQRMLKSLNDENAQVLYKLVR
jgi:hypothetical protein